MVASSKLALRVEASPDISRLVHFTDALNSAFGTTLSVPVDLGDSVKSFCSGLIEGQPHPWRANESFRRLGRRSRLSLSFSLFLFRKVVKSPAPDVHGYMDAMSREQDPPPPAFLDFCRRWIRKNLRGWDKGYFERVPSLTLPLSSCAERGRRGGGCRGLTLAERWDREDFCAYVLESSLSRPRGESKVVSVLSSGKWRTITCPPVVDNALRGVHSTLYDRLSRFKWLLRGDAKASSFRDFGSVPGEVFVSGDYEGATDNLNLHSQLEILSAVLSECVEVPPGIIQHALSAYEGSSVLRCGEMMCDRDGSSPGKSCSRDRYKVVQRRGQMMGQLLSFPLLCLVNYLTFLFAVGPQAPVRVNGDDIVFRADPGVADLWFRTVSVSGLKVSPGKTMVDRRYFSLNSSLFSSLPRGGCETVGFVRPRCIWRGEESSSESLTSLRGRWRALSPGMGKSRSRPFKRLFLLQNKHTIFLSRRSLTRCLGLTPDESLLRETGLWSRELYYLNKLDELELPPPLTAFSTGFTEHFERVSRHRFTSAQARGWEDALGHYFCSAAWTRDVPERKKNEDEWWSKVRSGSDPWGLGSLISRKVIKMLRLSRAAAWKWVYSNLDPTVFGRRKWEFGDVIWKRRYEDEARIEVDKPRRLWPPPVFSPVLDTSVILGVRYFEW